MNASLAALAFAALFQAPESFPSDPFPPATPGSMGLDAAKLEQLAGIVKRHVETEEIVGGELLVIRYGHTVLSRADGWKDREAKAALEPGALFCLRSMTKPVVATAVLMLVEEKKLGLDDPVARHLPAFDNDRSRGITIRQLLCHRSGLPLTEILGRDPSTIRGVRELADAAGARGPEVPPGSSYSYSDSGYETLGALVEVASGQSLAEFLRERILDPLGMRETVPIVGTGHPLRTRIASAYTGSRGRWTRFWSQADPPLFPTFLASQGLYASTRDYARFLALWKGRGAAFGKRLLPTKTARRALTSEGRADFPTTFEGLEPHYGLGWMLWGDPQRDGAAVAFGHGGSDGTQAWVWPGLDLMILYFTQSRGNRTTLDLERAIQQLLVDPLEGALRAGPVAYTPAELDSLTGLYRNEKNGDLARVFVRDGTLVADVVGSFRIEIEPTPERDRFKAAFDPGLGIEVERNPAGKVVSLVGRRKDRDDRFVRFEGNPQWPSLDAVLELRRKTNDPAKLDAAGAIRIAYALEMPAVRRSGSVVYTCVGTTRIRQIATSGGVVTNLAFDGATTRIAIGVTEATEADPSTAEALRIEQPLALVADWRAIYPEMRVVGLEKRPGGTEGILLLAVTPGGEASLFTLDGNSGLPTQERKTKAIPGLGRIPLTRRIEQWREVGGVRVPRCLETEFALPLLGTQRMELVESEARVAVPPGFFDLADLKRPR